MPEGRTTEACSTTEPRWETVSRRDLIWLSSLAGMFPLIVILNFYLFVCLTRLELGRWPVFNDPLGQAIPGRHFSLSIALSAVAFPFVSLVALAFTMWGRQRYADFPMGKLLVLILGSASLLLILAKADPGGFLNWFVD